MELKMTMNPEFVRNLWLELSPHRLIATPIILALTFYLFGTWKGPDGIQSVSTVLFMIVVGGWGGIQAVESILAEVKGGTWTLQRLTAMEPWPMTWGKLFGSTAFAWYVGAWCLAAFVFSGLYDGNTKRDTGLFHANLTLTVMYLVGACLLFQVMALVSGLINASWFRPQSRRYSRASILLLLLMGLPFISFFTRATEMESLNWWETGFAPKYFWLASIYVFVAWGLTGCYMLMRKQLQITNSPWAWFAFVLYLIFYADGFIRADSFLPNAQTTALAWRIGFAVAVSIAASYLMVFWERSSVVDILRLFRRLESGNYSEILREIPRWALTAGLAFSFGVAFLIYLVSLGYEPHLKSAPNLYAITVASLGFMTRDLAIVLYFHFSEKTERASLTALIYLGILYFLVPSFVRVLNLHSLLPWFLPTGGESVVGGGLPAFFQAGLMWLVVVTKWKRRTDVSARPIGVQ